MSQEIDPIMKRSVFAYFYQTSVKRRTKMSVLTDLIYAGSNAVAGLTEGAVNEAIEKYQNKLNKYEITFKIDNETYKFEEIKKI